MAEKLNEYHFTRGPKNRVTRYKQYLDGGVYRLAIPEDLPSVASVATLRRLAKEAGMKMRTATEGKNAVVVQAYREDTGA